MLSRWLERFLESWNAFDRAGIALYKFGMLSTVLEYLCTELECFIQGWNAFQMVGTLSRGLKCFLECWNANDRAELPMYMFGMLSSVLE
jgi:hypothetical protein